MTKGIVRNQKVTEKKVKFSRNLRRNMTKAETIFWETVKDRRLFNLKFRRQQIIDGFIVDFYCNEIDLVVEIDGGIHNTKKKREYDQYSTEVLKQRGLNIVRFSNEEVIHNKVLVMGKIKSFLC